MFDSQRFTNADQHQTAYAEKGAGDTTLVFVHGWSCNRHFFRPQYEFFADSYHVLAPDLPGHGESDTGGDEWSIESYAQRIAELVAAKGGSQTVLIGHSMAGAVVLEAIKYCQGKVKAVVLADTHVFDYGHLDEAQVDGFIHPMRADLQGFINNLVDNTLPEKRPEALASWIKQEMYSIPKSVAIPAFESLLHWDAMPSLDQAEIPVIAIHGKLIDNTALQRYQDKMRHYKMAEAGHFLQLEDPDAFNLLLQQALLENRVAE